MNFSSKVILDSINMHEKRLITLEVVYPRIIHSEMLTHRIMSRNSASSRAIPIKKLLDQVLNTPFVPSYFGKNQPGMQSSEEIDEKEKAEKIWLESAKLAHDQAEKLSKLNIHKQTVNRILEPFLFITVIVTATEWENFFNLRISNAAQPEFQKIAQMMKDSIDNSKPKYLDIPEWHLPYLQEDEEKLSLEIKQKLSIARCARVSYLTHDGKRDMNKDIELYDRLLKEKHLSPFEHVARPTKFYESNQTANFKGWIQYRKFLELNTL